MIPSRLFVSTGHSLLKKSCKRLCLQPTSNAKLHTSSNTSMKELDAVVRPARHEDYAVLMEMGDVLKGRDYLPAMYHRFINNPDVHCFVAVVENRPVAFFLYQLLDGGQTSFFRSGRIEKDFRKAGLTKLISDTLAEESRAIRPAIKRMSVCSPNHIRPTLFWKEGFKEVLRKRNISVCYRGEDVRPLSEQERVLSSVVKEMTVGDVEALFENKKLIAKLFPKGLLFNRSISYRPMRSNIQHIVNDFSSIYATTRFDKKETPTSVLKETMLKDHCDTSKHGHQKRNFSDDMLTQIDMVSCSEAQRTLPGLAYTCEIYCSDDVTSLQAHILHHVARMPKVTPGYGVLIVTFPDCIRDDDVVPLLAKYRIMDILQVPETHMVLYECDVLGSSKI